MRTWEPLPVQTLGQIPAGVAEPIVEVAGSRHWFMLKEYPNAWTQSGLGVFDGAASFLSASIPQFEGSEAFVGKSLGLSDGSVILYGPGTESGWLAEPYFPRLTWYWDEAEERIAAAAAAKAHIGRWSMGAAGIEMDWLKDFSLIPADMAGMAHDTRILGATEEDGSILIIALVSRSY
jgi:hypothetical protein